MVNLSEARAYRWLLRKYRPGEIKPQPVDTPDFVTSDGLGWEAKRVYKSRRGDYINIPREQLNRLKREGVFVLAIGDSDEPRAIIPGTKLQVGARFNNVTVEVIPREEKVYRLLRRGKTETVPIKGAVELTFVSQVLPRSKLYIPPEIRRVMDIRTGDVLEVRIRRVGRRRYQLQA